MTTENDGGKESTDLVKVTAAAHEAGTQLAVSRVAQEVQAAMVMARRFPRNVEASSARIMQACRRKKFADDALYAYPRGGKEVTGPTIRLAECFAQNWGNLDFGLVEIEQRHGESTVMAYAWDLETNTREMRIFQVPHLRKAAGTIHKLNDPRDIYEMVANQGMRRVRACILGMIPSDVQEAAIEACEETLRTAHKEPLIDRVQKMVAVFLELGVSTELLQKRLGHILDATTEIEMVALRKIYLSLRDGMSKPGDWFGETSQVEKGTLDMAQAVAGDAAAHTEPAAMPGAVPRAMPGAVPRAMPGAMNEPARTKADEDGAILTALIRDVGAAFAADEDAAWNVLAGVDPEWAHEGDWTDLATIPMDRLQKFLAAWRKHQRGKYAKK